MTCSLCDKPAMRHGTKGRAYCFAHEDHAFAQAKDASQRKSAEMDVLSDEARTSWRREKAMRAI